MGKRIAQNCFWFSIFIAHFQRKYEHLKRFYSCCWVAKFTFHLKGKMSTKILCEKESKRNAGRNVIEWRRRKMTFGTWWKMPNSMESKQLRLPSFSSKVVLTNLKLKSVIKVNFLRFRPSIWKGWTVPRCGENERAGVTLQRIHRRGPAERKRRTGSSTWKGTFFLLFVSRWFSFGIHLWFQIYQNCFEFIETFK